MRAYVRGDDHISGESITVPPHDAKLHRRGDCGERAISIRDESDSLRPGSQPAETADDSEGGRITAARSSTIPWEHRLHEIGMAAPTVDARHRHILNAALGEQGCNLLAVDTSTIEHVKGIDYLAPSHVGILLNLAIQRPLVLMPLCVPVLLIKSTVDSIGPIDDTPSKDYKAAD
jgi:hypothetical protein